MMETRLTFQMSVLLIVYPLHFYSIIILSKAKKFQFGKLFGAKLTQTAWVIHDCE